MLKEVVNEAKTQNLNRYFSTQKTKLIEFCADLLKAKSQKIIKDFFVLVLLFSIVFISHSFKGVTTSPDSKWSIYTAMSIIREGNTSLDEYKDILDKNHEYAVETVDGHLYNLFPIGTSLMAAPIVFILDQFSYRILSVDMEEHISQKIPAGIETFIASFFVALTSLFIYLIGRLVFSEVKYPLFLACIFAFCTSAWSTASRALWQHGPSMLLLTISLYLFLLAKSSKKYDGVLIRVFSLPLAFSFIVRPTNAIPIMVFTVLIFICYRKHFLSYCLWGMIVAIPFFIFNWLIYHTFLPFYYLPQRIGSGSHFLEALVGNLLSPSRGLFVFSPIFLFLVYGVVLKKRKKQLEPIDFALLLIIILHWFAISSFPHWWGGHCFGPRLFSDMIPFFLYFLIPVFQKLSILFHRKKIFLITPLIGLVLISFFIHYKGARSLGPFVWNFDPISVDEKPSRLWDWRDIQFLRPNSLFVDAKGKVHKE